MKPSPERSSDSGADAWLSVSDDLLWGFNHALSNRLAAISSIARILEFSDSGLEPLLSALANEVATLERTLKLLRMVPRDPRAIAEPILLNDLVPDVLHLHEMRGDLGDLGFETRFEGDPQPVWLEHTRLVHALLVGLSAVSRAAVAAGAGVVTVRVSSTTEFATIQILTPETGSIASEGSVCTEDEVEMGGVLIGDAGGQFAETRGNDSREAGRGVEIRLPTLLAIRERERLVNPPLR